MRHVWQGTIKGGSVRSQSLQDLRFSSLALLIERRHSQQSADLVLVWSYLFAELKRIMRSEQSGTDSRADFLITVHEPHHLVRNRIEKVALEKAGHRVMVVSLGRMEILLRELPPTIRLVRMAWWLPWLPGSRLPLAVTPCSTRKENAFTWLLNLRPAARSAPAGRQITAS